jgi:phosphatidylserine decarboxylase
MYSLLRFIPKNHLSYLVGVIVKWELPFGLSIWMIRQFAKHYGVNISEAEKQIEDYRSLFDFFTRKLKSGARPIDNGVVSPVDGRIVEFGEINNGQLIQAKGKLYTVESLLKNTEFSQKFINGFYITIYLAPGDYHRIHYPVSGKIVSSIYIQGALWPVNRWSVENIEELFSVNERLITTIDTNNSLVSVVKVGATNVGAIRVFYDEIVTNQQPGFMATNRVVAKKYIDSVVGEKGKEMAVFEMGSTVILLFEKKHFSLNSSIAKNSLIKVGQNIGELIQGNEHK